VNDPIRIGVDARELLGETTGVGRYLGELLQRWTARDDAATRRFILYSPEPLRLWGQTPVADRDRGGLTPHVVPGRRGTWWEQLALRRAARQDRLDVFFAPAYTAPIGLGVPFAVTIHDISFIAQPRWFRPRERWRRRLLTTYAARNASVVFTDSEFSRSEIEKHLHVARERLSVIPPGVVRLNADTTVRIQALEAGTTEARAALREPQDGPEPGRRTANREPRQPLVLFTGSLFNRRRLPDLIAAFALASRSLPDARLVIVGADRTWPRQDLRMVAAANNVESRVEIRDYVTQDELTRLYEQASVFAFLSEYEGFGLTPLEALGAGVPIVVLDTAIAREVYGPAAIYVGRDVDGTAAVLQNLLTSRDGAAGQLARAAEVLARYSWDRAADETLRHIDRIARARGKR
jgi:glycosyltransferase involved in cell wall biosynthesis